MIEKFKNNKSINHAELIAHWRQNPVIAAQDILGIDLDKPQQVQLNAWWTHDTSTSIFTRGGGKTFSGAVFCVLSGILYAGQRVGIISPSFRQCLFLDQQNLLIPTSRGFFRNPQHFFDSIEIGDGIQSLQNTNAVLNKWKNKEQSGFIVTADRGFKFSGVGKHQVLTIGKDLSLIYKSLDEITSMDMLAVSRKRSPFGTAVDVPVGDEATHWAEQESTIPDRLNEDLCYLIGLLVGNGHIRSDEDKYDITLTSADDDIVHAFIKIVKDQFGIDTHSFDHQDKKAKQITFSCKRVTRWLLSLGLQNVKGPFKKTPNCILQTNQQNVAAYLSGLMDTDGGGYTGLQSHNKGSNYHILAFSTSSVQLAYETRSLLLAFGILASVNVDRVAGLRTLSGRTKLSVCETCYKVRFSNREDARLFRDLITYRCVRKQKQLEDFLKQCKAGRSVCDFVPHCIDLVSRIERKLKVIDGRNGPFVKLLFYLHMKRHSAHGFCKATLQQLLSAADTLGLDDADTRTLRTFLASEVSAIQVISKAVHHGESFDIEVDNEHCYNAGGLIHHNSKFCFAEVEKLYEKSPMFQEACVKPPTRQPESCLVKFDAAPGKIGSVIEALPMGTDGAKIRGARYYRVFADEVAQIDAEILDTVVNGFMATNADPMERVRELARQRELVNEGKLSASDILKPDSNKLVQASTAYYQYNHLWTQRVSPTIKSILQAKYDADRKGESTSRFKLLGGGLNGGQIPHRVISDGTECVIAFQYTDMSEGFMDATRIKATMAKMSDYKARMEYFAFFPPDSEGFYRRSLLDQCRSHKTFCCRTDPVKGMIYVLGVDPARSGDNFAISLFEVDSDGGSVNLVRVGAWNKKSFPHMHTVLRTWIKHYGVKHIGMDAGGGGTAIRDLLASKENLPFGQRLILEKDFDEHRSLVGDRILEPLIQFANADWCHDSNYTMVSALQHGKLLIASKPNNMNLVWTPEIEDLDTEMEEALQEWSSIVQMASGNRARWDTPVDGMRKDRYSAILIGFWIAWQVLDKGNKPTELAFGGWNQAT